MYKPFCSKRCKLVDIGTWANEKFKIEDNLNSLGIKIGLVGEDDV